MAASGFTPISLYYSTTASAVPTSGNLANGELGLNIADMKLYAKNSAGTVTLLASNAGASGSVTSVSGTGTVNGLTLTGTVTTSGSLTLGGTLSGTASININGTVGATTPTTGAFTTVAVSSNISADNAFLAGNLTLPLTGKLNFNGNTATDYMVGPSNGTINSYIASSLKTSLTSNGLTITGAMVSTTATVDINSASQSSGITLQNSNTGGYGTQFNSALYGYAGSPAAMFSVLSMQTFYDGTSGYVNFNTKAQPQSTEVTALSLRGNGNVGIGTSSLISGYFLTVNGQGAFTGPTSDVDGNGGVRINYGNSSGTVERFLTLNANGTTNAAIGLNMVDSTAGSMTFSTRYGNVLSERFRMGSLGQFGIAGANYGTAGQVLTSGGASAAPTWAAAGGGGSVFSAFSSTGESVFASQGF